MKTETRYILLGLGLMAGLGVVLRFLPGDNTSAEAALNKLKIATGFTLLGLILLFGVAILIYIAKGNIDLSDLLSDGTSKGASMSRFQLLIFTLVIALSLFLVVVAKMDFPTTIPPEVLTLLGISASTYAVSKGIQVSANPAPPPPPQPPQAGAGPDAGGGAAAQAKAATAGQGAD